MTETSITESSVAAAVDAALAAAAGATSTAELKEARTAHAGEGSPIALLNRAIGTLPKPEKPAAGKLVGSARGRINHAFQERMSELEAQERAAQLRAEAVDVTEASFPSRLGARHPLSLLMDEVSDVFIGMGWEIAEGPEVENEWFNFDALNFDADHPARAMQDTFFVAPADR
ncbi:MAG: phenylalanine--tRNA ligase subunit alpha, partial [Microbacteriaceae bacterium]|nr:phenylalanine--tRNA ligase subunit alpha [Microbacteriaceae bacterium]